jgi:Cof subfamily protein (haloacid dehalogenase superfamily)
MQNNVIQLNLPDFSKCPGTVAIDLDGTLFDNRTRLSRRNHRAIDRCLEREIPVVIVTSRPARSVHRYLGNELTETCSLVLENGAIVQSAPPLSGRFQEPLPRDAAGNITDIIFRIDPGIRITIELEGYRFGTNLPREPEELWEINSATPDMQIPLEAAIADEPTKISASGPIRNILVVIEAVAKELSDAVSLVPADEMTFLNITSCKATKPESLRRLLSSRGITLDNVVAFGDDIPDIGLLQACGIPVAVANAVLEVKALTHYCTASNDDDGVAIVLEKMLRNI